ncbi:serine hydrolase domain-containing protein [Granulosicoccus antarcticus]|uniref:D-alanyl-D-alanine-carboxypeptidase/endopeptidase AmpH n=1 Tax=Granulosicoccus antarcticus IMCC3135 TaxID=1192854 RepID=A0A2Z2NPC5_9GAMM|nr:serine hydrolase [Granulosicoccus antarcticus]ASJ70630.1 D-alanyl-D-alanine-carboxypeptidase/endopeptidase AmpH [Granulosicoccus antarcticus IMCC3135]
MKRRTLLKSAAYCLAATSLPAFAATGSETANTPVTAADAINAFADAARQLDRLHGLVVMKQGEIVLAENFRGPPVDKAVNVKSISKSVVAGLVGCAIERGSLVGVDATLGELAPDLVPVDADVRIAKLSVQDFLTMRLGLESQSGGNYGRWAASDDWVRYALTRPFTSAPGGKMQYSTAGWHVLGAILSEVTGKSLLTLSREWLGEPLDIEFATWTRDPQGRYLGGNEMSMSPLEMARFGELYRLDGRWNDELVMVEDWVRQSFEPKTVSPWSDHAYGYGWYLLPLAGQKAAYARGYGGQLIHVVPQAGLVVAMTSDSSRAARSDGYIATLHSLVEDYLIATQG